MAQRGEDRMIVAVMTGSIAEVQRELQVGSRLDTYSLCGQTPLGVACDRNDRNMMRFLLECGVDPDEIDYEDYHAMEYAIWNQHNEAIDFLLDYGDDEARRKRGEMALFYAAQCGVPNLVRRLLAHGVDVNAVYEDSTALDQAVAYPRGSTTKAAQAQRRQVTKILLEAGADVTQRQGGVTAMYWACRYGDRKMVRLLRNVGARIELTEAAMIGDMDTVRLLLDQGENPNSPYPSGYTALINAAHNGHADVVRLLLERGADPYYTREDYPRTALAEAADEGHSDVVALFLDQSLTNVSISDGSPFEKTGERHVNACLVELLLGRGRNINGGDQKDNVPLIKNAVYNSPLYFRLLLLAGADVNLTNDNGYTALICATERGVIENVQMLLDAGADVNIRNTHGWTALNYAIFKGHEEIIALLRAAGGVAVSEDDI